jgi:hypothetical protein
VCVLPRANIHILGYAAAFAALFLASAGERAFAAAGCLNSASSLDPSEISAFIEQPTKLLERYPAGGPAMSARVQRLAASDPSTIPALIALAKDAKPLHIVALSMGLGRATAHCSAKRPDIARAIRQLVAAEGSPSLRALFSSEATVTELANGVLSESGPSTAPGDAAPVVSGQIAVPSAEALKAIISGRAGSLFPTGFPVPPGPPPETSGPTPYRGADQHTTAARSGGNGASPTPAPADGEGVLSSLNETGSEFFASFRSGGVDVAPLEGDQGARTLPGGDGSPGGIARFFARSRGESQAESPAESPGEPADEAKDGGTFRDTISPTH